MFCPHCGQENIAGAGTCETCGADLTRVTVEQPDSQPAIQADSAVRPVKAYAGFWIRFVAFIIDGVLVGIISWIVLIPTFLLPVDASYSTVISTQLIVGFASYLVLWLYYAIMEASSKQATLGKMVLGIIVTDEAGNRISFGRATGRYFGKFLSSLILGIGYIMIAFTGKKQGLHDLLASAFVIKN